MSWRSRRCRHRLSGKLEVSGTGTGHLSCPYHPLPVYQTLLTSRYLTSRVIPLIAIAAVALCVALVIVVVSVMTGFLDMLQSAGRTLMGDVIISYSVSGIPEYEDLIDRLDADGDIEAATPIVDGWGLLRMPYPDRKAKQSETVQVWGIDPASIGRVTEFANSLVWETTSANQQDWLLLDAVAENIETILPLLKQDQKQPFLDTVNDAAIQLNYREVGLQGSIREVVDDTQWQAIVALDERLADSSTIHRQGLTFQSDRGHGGIVTGLHVSDGNQRQHDGSYRVTRNDYWWLPRFEGTLTMLPIDAEGGVIEPESVIMPFLNEFQSGVFLIDESRIYVPIEVAQRLLHLDAAELVDADDPTVVIGKDPARATIVLVRGKDGITPEELRDTVMPIYREFEEAHAGDLISPPSLSAPGLSIHTWREQQRKFTDPIEKERELMRTLFSIVYLVCAALILSIFWAIVFEKTRDIGILRSLGASRPGIVWIFLQYGGVIGIIGALLGLVLGWAITHNINTIHNAMSEPPIWITVIAFVLAATAAAITIARGRKGHLLPIVLGLIGVVTFGLLGGSVLWIRHIGGVVVWDPAVYYFSTIPNAVDWPSATVTLIGAVIFCLLGAVIPAAKAADTDPVEALRHE